MGNEFTGYNPLFIGDKKLRANLPVPGDRHKGDIAPIEGKSDGVADYINYSLVMSSSRKFPIFTASNINGILFKQAERPDNWRRDKRLKSFQWGDELYSAEKSDFDKGHMTRREDVQWGETEEKAIAAAESTFYYTNAVPQHSGLNKKIWKRLEDYILHAEATDKKLQISVFTGPVLNQNDPLFVTPVKNNLVQIPVIFWKVVVFAKEDGKLYKVGFLMSQHQLLRMNGIIREPEGGTESRELFMEFRDAETYQVPVSLIEKLADLKLPKAVNSYKKKKPLKLVLEEVDIKPDRKAGSEVKRLNYSIPNLVL
jgi:endonuclease G, mitochondrial